MPDSRSRQWPPPLRPAALEAARLVKVQYETMPFVVERSESPRAECPAGISRSCGGKGLQREAEAAPRDVPQKGNVRGPTIVAATTLGQRATSKRDLPTSAAIVEAEYRTQVQTHSALETHGVVADWKPDGLTVYASTQGTMSVRDELAEIFNLPKTKVRVFTEYMGGGFGAKFGASNPGAVAAHLSKKAGAPVRMFCDRKEEQWGTGNRPDAHMYVKAGAR